MQAVVHAIGDQITVAGSKSCSNRVSAPRLTTASLTGMVWHRPTGFTGAEANHGMATTALTLLIHSQRTTLHR